MGQQLAFGDRPSATIAVAEGLQGSGVTRLGLKPEIGFEGRDRDYAFDVSVPAYECERPAGRFASTCGSDSIVSIADFVF